jgi:SAM-dependent methyltransferase
MAPEVSWPDREQFRRMVCPNCATRGLKPVLLSVRFARPGEAPEVRRVLRCPECTCPFYEDQELPDYAGEAMFARGRCAFYLQQGAGLSVITRPLAQLRRPPGSAYLEIGCGFGFGLDFATCAKGFVGIGLDPGRVAALGREQLGLDIEQRLLGEDEPALAGRFDVVMAAETIEHVPSPGAFVRTLRRALRPDGVLVLTTPDGDALSPATAPGGLVGLLSPGLHLTFQTATSLRAALRQAGFRAVTLRRDGSSLVAFAADREEPLLADEAALRAAYRGWLEGRASEVAASGDLGLGLAGRALWEAVNDADLKTAGHFAARLRDACRTRFGFDLEGVAALPEEARHCSLERLAELLPLGLGSLLYADCLRRLLGGTPRAGMAERLLLAAEAADALRRATRLLAMEDALSEDIAWTSRAEALLCAAAAGAADLAQRAEAIGIGPGGEAERRESYLARALVEAVNAGHYRIGLAFAEATGLQHAPWAVADAAPRDLARRDAMFCLGVLDVQDLPGAEPARGWRRFAAIEQAVAPGPGEEPPPLWQAARGGRRQAAAMSGRVEDQA